MINFCGPSYSLANRKVSIQRAVNLYLSKLEASEKAQFILQSVPGLILRATISGEFRGSLETNARAFVVYGATLYEVFSDYSIVSRGTLNTPTGHVSMSYGLTQLVMVDGANGYVLTLTTNAFTRITTAAFTGADTVDFIDNYFLFTKNRSGQKYQLTAINDATTIDALDFASSESAPDDLVGHLVVQAGALLYGTLTTELHVNTGNVDFPLERSRGSGFQVGLMATASLKLVDNTPYWVGRDKNGSGIVYALSGGQARRISNDAIEQALQVSTDLTLARAWCYQKNGKTFYGINAPGLTSTWVYEASTGTWHERCDLDGSGQYKASRVTGVLFAFNKHFGCADGAMYELSDTTYKNGTDVLVRERTSPHEAVAGRLRQIFENFWLDATTGGAGSGISPQVEFSYSNNSGSTWSNVVTRSLGMIGEVFPVLRWKRLGMARDRVWKVKCSSNAPFSIIAAGSDTKVGNT